MKAAVLGATGLVGQRFVQLLQGHPWFELTAVSGSERRVGKQYGEVVNWRMETKLSDQISEMEVQPTAASRLHDTDVVFSALPAYEAAKVEEQFAEAGHAVISNASAHRMDPDVPLINPEVNAEHLALLDTQRKRRKWDGALVTNPNCTAAVLTLALKPIQNEFGLEKVFVCSMQSLSGAGYPGIASLDILDNVIPFIENEEEKVERETRKMLGTVDNPAKMGVSASCNRVAVLDGHMEDVFVKTSKPCDVDSAVKALESFTAQPQKLKLPTAPRQPVIVRLEKDRPQPRLDRLAGNGMSVVVGRIREDQVAKGIKFVALGHNTIRGAAGCALLIAETMKETGYL